VETAGFGGRGVTGDLFVGVGDGCRCHVFPFL
jgi:hypothetical protein